MASFLILRLAGPLMSFGGVTVDETRPTRRLPTLSQLTGLLANALGWRCGEGERLNRLQARLVYGARADRPGEALVDYQNAHIQPGRAMWRTRAEAPLRREGGEYTNIQRWRHYLTDARVTVALTLLPPDEDPGLDEVARALYRPFRPLFLGRVGCPPSGFLHAGERVEAESVHAALAAAPGPGAAGECLAEWPAEGPLAGAGAAARRVFELADARDWVNDVHTGWRLVASGFVSPAAVAAGEG